MAPNNWEEQIKQGLQGREIQPSAQAWDRLDAMLTVAEEKKTKRPLGVYFRHMTISASVLVLLSIGFYFTSNPSKTDTQHPQEVTCQEPAKAIPTVKDSKAKDILVITPTPNEAVVVQPKTDAKEAVQSKKYLPQNTKHTLKTQIIPTTEQEVYTAVPAQPKVGQNLPTLAQPTSGIQAITNIAVTQPQLAKTNIKVDASSLLNQVDGELNQSFRERLFDRLNRNYQSAKSALATRNQE